MSLKHVVHRRVHKERAQPKARAKLGHLEKHKDYVKRARDYHKKQDALKKLHQKAFFKNDDEFAFGMLSRKQVDGKLRAKPRHLSEGELKLLDSQDARYVGMMERVDKKAAERRGEQLHFLDLDRPNCHTLFLDDDEEEPGDVATELSTSVRRKRKLLDYNVAAHFDTHPALLDKKANRPRMKQLEIGVFSHDEELERAKKNSYRELLARQERSKKLERVRGELELRNNLRTKGKRQKVADGKDGQSAVYKWQFKRKR